jgi:hypothetical protein
MDDHSRDLATDLPPEGPKRIQGTATDLASPSGPASIHYTKLPDGPPNSPIAVEWNFYRRIVGQLLVEGHEGKWLLIKNEEIVGIWASEAKANAVRQERFMMQPVLMKQILDRERILHIGYNRLCRS